MKAIRIFLFVLILIGIALLFTQKLWVPRLVDSILAQKDYKNITYIIGRVPVTLVNGHAENLVAPGSVSKTVTNYFGNEAFGDLNADGVDDVAFILSQSGVGTGTFYYVVVALKTMDGYQGTNAVFIGDRIAPQTTEIKNGQLIVNYADRRSGEPMTAIPSVGITKYFKVRGTTLQGI